MKKTVVHLSILCILFAFNTLQSQETKQAQETHEKIVSLLNNSVNDRPEKTPFFIFSKASIITTLSVTDFAISILSIRSTPAWLRLPKTKEILANIDLFIKFPKIGSFNIT